VTSLFTSSGPAADFDTIVARVAIAVPELTSAQVYAAVEEATWTIAVLLGGRYHPAASVIDSYDTVPGCDVRLDWGPVEEVTSVEWWDPCTETATAIAWCLKPPRDLCAASGSGLTGLFPPCGCRGTFLRVAYSVGPNWPPGALRAITSLAVELAKSDAGQACELPERMNTITRQGVSWTVFDPGTHMAQGLTGVSSVDNWLAIARRAAGGQVHDPLHGTLVARTITEDPVVDTLGFTASRLNLMIYQGDDFGVDISLGEDITGWTFEAQLRAGYADTTSIVEMFDCTIVDAEEGIVRISMAKELTQNLDPNLEPGAPVLFDGLIPPYRWDLQATDTETTTLRYGQVGVIGEVTRPAEAEASEVIRLYPGTPGPGTYEPHGHPAGEDATAFLAYFGSTPDDIRDAAGAIIESPETQSWGDAYVTLDSGEKITWDGMTFSEVV
jgi:hypothetical protein